MLIYKSLVEEDYHKALKNQEFDLAYQPIMNFNNDSFETFEAFIRWHHPVLGTLPPGIFMGNIEKYNLQEEMTEYIFNLAVTQILNNSRSGYGETGVSINLSLQEFYNPKTVIQLQKALSKLPFPEFLGIEVTPKILTAYADQKVTNLDPEYHPDAVPSDREKKYLENISEIVQEYARLGITLAIDTTEHVIGGLIRADILGFHALKISSKVVQRALLTKMESLQEYVQASKDFKIPIIAVGIENKNLFKIAYEHGLTYAQGLFLCPPLCLKNPKEFSNHLAAYHSAKENILNIQDSRDSLKKIQQNLSAENIPTNFNKKTPETLSKSNQSQKNLSLSQSIETSMQQIENEESKLPEIRLAKQHNNLSDDNDFDATSLSTKKMSAGLNNLNDVFSDAPVDHSYLDTLDIIEKQLIKAAPINEQPSYTSFKTKKSIDNSLNKGLKFGRRKRN